MFPLLFNPWTSLCLSFLKIKLLILSTTMGRKTNKKIILKIQNHLHDHHHPVNNHQKNQGLGQGVGRKKDNIPNRPIKTDHLTHPIEIMKNMKKNMNDIMTIDQGMIPSPRNKHLEKLKCALNMKKYLLHLSRDYAEKEPPVTMLMDNLNLEVSLILEKPAYV